MEPLSITATCVGLATTITRASLVVISFVKDVRAARSDLDAVSRELLSLKTVLELLADDVNDSTDQSIPQTLQKQIAGIVTNCTGVVVDIEQTLKKHEGGKPNKAAKWVASGKSDVAKLQLSLEAHKSALEIALDMVTLTLAREIKADTQEILNDTSAIKEDTAQILAEIARLQEQLPRDENQRSAGYMLERYLDNLTSYAETVCDPLLDGSDRSRPTSWAGSSGEAASERNPSPPSGWKCEEPASAESSVSMATPSPAGKMRIENNDETIQRSIIEATEQRGIIPPEPAEASPRTEQEHEHVQIPANFWSFAPEHGYTDVDGSVTRERLERSGTLEDIDHRYDPPAPPAMSPQLKPSPNNNHQIASATTPSMLTTKADTGAADTEFGTECLQRKPSYMTPQELREGLEKDVDALKEIGEAQTREFKALEEKSDALRKVAKALREQLEAFLKNTQNQQEISKILAAIASNQAWSEATLLIYSKNQQELREARLENARLQEVAESRLKQARAQELAESRHSDAPRTGPSMITTPLHIEAVDPHSRPGSLLDESASLKKLTTYAAYTIKKCPPRDAKKERRRTLERVEEIWAQEDIIKKIKKLSESQQNVADKQAAVNHDVRRQITSLIDNLASAEFDTAFEWSLVQLDIIKEPVTSPRGKNLVSSRLYKSVTVFVKRTPRKDLNSCHFEGRLKPATAQQEQGFGDLKDLDDAWRKNAEDRDTKGPATKNRLARLQHIPSDDRLEDVVESSLSNSVGIESRERAEVPPTSCVDTESPSKLYNKWFEDYLKRPSIAQQCPIFEEKKSGSFDTIARYFEKTPKITEWRMDDLEALGVYCQRYVLPSKAIRDEIVRVLRKLGITFREYENLTAFEPEVTIPYGFTCHNRTKYQIFRICIVWIPAQGVNIIRSQNIDGGNVALYERMIDRISKLLRLQS